MRVFRLGWGVVSRLLVIKTLIEGLQPYCTALVIKKKPLSLKLVRNPFGTVSAALSDREKLSPRVAAASQRLFMQNGRCVVTLFD